METRIPLRNIPVFSILAIIAVMLSVGTAPVSGASTDEGNPSTNAGGTINTGGDREWQFSLPPNSSSEVFQRPKNAEYFWWDTDEAVQVELVFEDGTKVTVGSAKEYSKKIISVKFLNPSKKPFR